jgi:site-specific DNA-methyltransferase (adenine-specific)
MESGTPYFQKSGKQKEDAIFNAKTAVSVITNNSGTRNPKSIIKFNKDNKKIHPTQKPVELLEYLIKTYSNENEIVLDFTMGSGSTGVACLNTNRKFIGIEKDEKYFNIAKERLK